MTDNKIFNSTLNTRSLPVEGRIIIRSDVPLSVTEEEAERLIQNGVTTVIDLREEKEYKKRPCPLKDNPAFDYYSLPVTGGGDTPPSPEAVAETYLGMLDSQMDKIADTVLNAEGGALYFCGAGKDRTGVVSAVIMKRLGISDAAIIEDYMKTKENLHGFLTDYVKAHPEVDIRTIMPCEDNIRAVLTAIDKKEKKGNE